MVLSGYRSGKRRVTVFLLVAITAGFTAGMSAPVTFPADQVAADIILFGQRIPDQLEAAIPGADAANPPNVVVIDIDRLSASHMPCYGYVRNTTPNICRFGEENLLFTDAIAQSGWTASSVASLFTSQYPQVHGLLTHTDRIAADERTLAEVLDRNGYTTWAFPTNRDDGTPAFLDPRYALDQGFDMYHADGVFLDDQTGILRNLTKYGMPEPFFLYVQGFDPHRYDWWKPPAERNESDPMYRGNYSGILHDPAIHEVRRPGSEARYYPTPSQISLEGGRYYLPLANGTRVWLSRKDVDHVLERYDAAIHRADQAFARLIGLLKSRGMYEDTIIVVTANHGEVLNTRTLPDRRRFGHGGIWDDVTRVPLLIRVPDAEHRTVTEPVELIDVFPTVLAETGVSAGDAVAERLQGDSVRPLYMDADGYPDDYAFTADYGGKLFGVRNETWKLVTDSFSTELFDLESDPLEQWDVSAQHPNITAQLRSILERHRLQNQRQRLR